MLKTYDIKVGSNFSSNYYNGFKVDTVKGCVYFHQCDARRNGQVARYFVITFNHKNGVASIEARSANGSRYEQFSRTQCLKLALELLNEARSEARQVNSTKYIKAASPEESSCTILGIMSFLVTLIPVYFLLSWGVEAYATDVRMTAATISGMLTVYFLGNAYLLRKERYSEE